MAGELLLGLYGCGMHTGGAAVPHPSAGSRGSCSRLRYGRAPGLQYSQHDCYHRPMPELDDLPVSVTVGFQLVLIIIAAVVAFLALRAVVVLGVLMALDLFGIDIGPAIAGLGVVGIAVGLGAQTLIRDWLAGIFVVVENQYSQGDRVRIAGVEGTVEDFSLRRTKLREPDGTVHNVPNGQIVVATNLTRTAPAASIEPVADEEPDD